VRAFKLIRRENLNVREYAVRRDRLQRWFQAQWQFVDRESEVAAARKTATNEHKIFMLSL
jgi:hypothetical protein